MDSITTHRLNSVLFAQTIVVLAKLSMVNSVVHNAHQVLS